MPGVLTFSVTAGRRRPFATTERTILGLPEFDEELFNQQLAYATVPADNEIVFHFRDGHEISRTFVQKRQMPRQTEERKKHMSEVMKEKWRERHAKND